MKVELNIPEERLHDIFCNAMYSSREFIVIPEEWDRIEAHWKSKLNKDVREKYPDPYIERKMWAYIEAGKHIAFYDEYQEQFCELSWHRVTDGTAKMAKDYDWHFMNIITEEDDATTAEVWLQCVLLGDVVYG
jgi:hypothetical protein